MARFSTANVSHKMQRTHHKNIHNGCGKWQGRPKWKTPGYYNTLYINSKKIYLLQQLVPKWQR